MNIDNDISSRLAKASHSLAGFPDAYGTTTGSDLIPKWQSTSSHPACTHGPETLVVYRGHVRKLEQFHVCCLRRLTHVRWQEKKSNTEDLQICNITGIEAFLITAQLRWTDHVLLMGDNRLPKVIFCSELGEGTRYRSG